MAKTLLLFSSRPEDIDFANAIAVTADLVVKPTPALGDFVKNLQEGDNGAIFIDCDSMEQFKHMEKAIETHIGFFNDKINTNIMHYLSNEDLEHRPYLSASPLFGSFVLRKYKTGEAAKALAPRYANIVKATMLERCFGLKNFFSEKSQLQIIKLKKSTQKQQIVEAIRGFLLKAKYPTRMANVIANAIDELIMNAIFTAPADEMGRRIFDQTPRDKEMDLTGKQEVEVQVAFDGRQVGISASDNYGAIDKVKLIKHLSTVYTDEQYKVKTSVAGAGIGLATTFRSGGSLIFAFEKGTRTEVAVIFERLDSYREFKDQFRFICTQSYL